MKENLCILTSDNLRNGGEKKHYSACHLSMTETHDEPPAFDIFCKTTPIQEDFFSRSLPPQDSVTAIALTEFSERFSS